MLYEAQFRSPAGSGQMLKAIEALDLPELHIMEAVSYTHLDVYKRQVLGLQAQSEKVLQLHA